MSAPATTTTALAFAGVLARIDTPDQRGMVLAAHDGLLTDHPEGVSLPVPLISYAKIDGAGAVIDGPQTIGGVDGFEIDGTELRITGTALSDTPDGAALVAALAAGKEVRVGFSIGQAYEVDPESSADAPRITRWQITHVVAETEYHPTMVAPWDGMVIRAAHSSPAADGA